MRLDVSNLTVTIDGRRLVDGVGFRADAGERIGLIGESGSGKSLTLLALLGLLPEGASVTGSVLLDGRELVGLPERELAGIRGRRIGLVLQDPGSALDPLRRIGAQIAEPIRLHRLAGRAAAAAKAIELAAEVGLPDPAAIIRRYPHELSGGQRQRAQIAIALAAEPDVLLADEPTTALDVSVQAGVLELFGRLARDRAMTTVFVTHDLAVLRIAADRASVLADGAVVEEDTVARLLSAPSSETARALLRAAAATAWPSDGGETPVGRDEGQR